MTSSIRLPSLHQGQLAVRESDARIKWVAAGRRWRKTSLGVVEGVEAAVRSKTVFWGAPVYDQVRIGWEEMRKATHGVASFKRSETMLSFPGGGRVIFRSLDNPDNARGHTVDLVILDEAGYIPEEAWSSAIRPMLLDTGGRALLMGTPNGKNWFYGGCVSAANHNGHAFFNAPTLGCKILDDSVLVREPHPLENPEIPFEELVDIFETVPRMVFEQEVMALFKEASGSVFRNVDESVDIGRTGNLNPELEKVYYGGADFARIKDFTVMTVIDNTGKQVFFDRFGQISWALQLERIARIARIYGLRKLVVDATAVGDPLVAKLEELLAGTGTSVEPFNINMKRKVKLIDGLAIGIEHNKLRLMDVAVQTNELLEYQYELTRFGNARMSAPAGSFDDTVIALALATSEALKFVLPAGASVMPTGEVWDAIKASRGDLWVGATRQYEMSRGF